jgi:2-polyprenyl-3-methyl-5-hydroxy-6-metoxy-1,4-benzoquinol methylase
VVDSWDEYAAGWDDDEAVRAYAAAAFASLCDVAADSGLALAGSRVVDFGAGTGQLTERLVEAGASVVAVDTSPAMLAVVDDKAARLGWSGVRTTTDLASVSPGHDLVVCSSVCAFLDDYPATMTQLAGLIRPGGLIVQWDWEREASDATGETGDESHGLTRAEVAGALDQAGLVQVTVETAFSVPMGDQRMEPLIGWGRRPDEAR